MQEEEEEEKGEKDGDMETATSNLQEGAHSLPPSLPHSLTHSLPHLLTLKKHTQDCDKAVRRGPRRAGGHLAVLPGGAVTAAHLRSLAAHVRPGPLRGFHVAQESGPWRARLSRGVGVGGVAGCGAALALGSRGSGGGEREREAGGAGQGERRGREARYKDHFSAIFFAICALYIQPTDSDSVSFFFFF